MTAPYAVGTAKPSWAEIADAAVITAAMAHDALRAMELAHTRSLDEQRPTAERLERVACEMGRDDLALRARLVLANVKIRQGSPIEGSEMVHEVLDCAERAGDAFAIARSHFLLAWIAYSIGDNPSAQTNGIRSVELLPHEVPTGILMDHLTIVGIAFSPGPECQLYFGEVLQLAEASNNPTRLLSIHNNMAYTAAERGDLAVAEHHVEQMLAHSAQARTPLNAVQLETVARVHLLGAHPAEAIASLQPVLDALPDDPSGSDPTMFTESHALPLCLVTLAEAHRRLGETDRAGDYLGRALRLTEQRNLRMLRVTVLQEEARLAAALGDYRRAYDGYVHFHDELMSLQSDDARARSQVVQASFQAERNRQNAERFRELAMRDALTGIYNRRYMDDLLETAVAEARQTRSPLSIAILDADFFKRINDEISHEAGDAVLRALASLLVATRPETDRVCRLGGEEFVVVMPNVPEAEAISRCETLRRAVAEYPWAPLTGSIPVTVSVGVTTAQQGRTSPTALLSDADRNLYAAKRSGRNRVVGDAR